MGTGNGNGRDKFCGDGVGLVLLVCGRCVGKGTDRKEGKERE